MSVITVENIGKRYRVGADASGMLRDRIADALRHPVAALRRKPRDTFWALRDVSFEVQEGEVLGLIGRNGAGKSTLLKVLSRITKPTVGHAEIHGRVGSLLEVGTGFHPELSGRENVSLNGAILGMGRREIARKFDEIVAFAEVEKFIDTPVKYYSSGMYIRLAFAVAAHLETEILFVDEVLSVGDVSFQKKCLGKMGDVAAQGRTVIFVSHNVTAVTRLCSSCMLLRDGKVVKEGRTHEVMDAYLQSELDTTAARVWQPEQAPGDEIVRLAAVRARSVAGEVTEAFDIRQPIGVDVVFDVLKDGVVLAPNVHIFNQEGITIFVTIDRDEKWHRIPRPAGRYTSTVWIPANFLAEGSFVVDTAVTTFIPFKVRFHEHAAIGFQVIDSIDGDSVRADYAGTLPGVVRPMLEWQTEFEQKDPGDRQKLDTHAMELRGEHGR
ncbi:MAG TPA: ABC transporter ATP-binding protein [Candidatus Acidoferrales bacterium]|nr:ABC transporter ATP-binding protein [Candidatus Acidoferrales bacterium]